MLSSTPHNAEFLFHRTASAGSSTDCTTVVSTAENILRRVQVSVLGVAAGGTAKDRLAGSASRVDYPTDRALLARVVGRYLNQGAARPCELVTQLVHETVSQVPKKPLSVVPLLQPLNLNLGRVDAKAVCLGHFQEKTNLTLVFWSASGPTPLPEGRGSRPGEI